MKFFKQEILEFFNLEEILFLSEKTYVELENKEWFSLNNREFHILVFKNNEGKYLGIKNEEGKLIAYTLLLYNDKFKICENGGTIDIIIVDSEYRGNRLQIEMIKSIEQMAKDYGLKYLVATVHPKNFYSKKKFFNQNYKSIEHIFKINDEKYIRELFFKYLE